MIDTMKKLMILLPLLAYVPGVPGEDISTEEIQAFEGTKQVFHENCAMCHGFDGVPMLPGVPNFAQGERLEKSDEELLVIMRDGKDLMPPWKDAFDDEKQRRLLNFVRGIAGDKVFAERCNRCHGRRVPALGKDLPKTRKALLEYQRDLKICSGHDIEKTLSHQELVDVVMYLRTLKKF